MNVCRHCGESIVKRTVNGHSWYVHVLGGIEHVAELDESE